MSMKVGSCIMSHSSALQQMFLPQGLRQRGLEACWLGTTKCAVNPNSTLKIHAAASISGSRYQHSQNLHCMTSAHKVLLALPTPSSQSCAFCTCFLRCLAHTSSTCGAPMLRLYTDFVSELQQKYIWAKTWSVCMEDHIQGSSWRYFGFTPLLLRIINYYAPEQLSSLS